MKYLEFPQAPRFADEKDSWLIKIVRIFFFWTPLANPDFQARYKDVTTWWLEIGDKNDVVREIGFDAHGTPIVGAPLGKNMGVFTDSGSYPEHGGTPVDTKAFEAAWGLLKKSGNFHD